MIDRLAHQVLLASFSGPGVPTWLHRRADLGLGGVCLFGSNLVAGAAAVTAQLRSPTLVATDEEGGDVTRLWAGTGSPVPGNAALGAVDDVALTNLAAAALGAALRDAGIDLTLAPVADVNCEPFNPVIGVRSFGPDPILVGRHVAAAVTGFQSAGVAACVKHWPGHGATRADSHHELPVLDVPAAVLDGRELEPFRSAIAAGAASIMTAHVLVPALDDRPATVSSAILTELLRQQLGFEGAIVTDALDMQGIGGPAAIPGNVVRALAAGADLCCLGPDATDGLVEACVDAVVGAVAAGALDEGRLHDAAARVAAIRQPAGTGPVASLEELGAKAAARALRLEGELPDLRGAHVVELDRPPMMAAGAVPWGLGAELAALDPSVTFERLPERGMVDAALAAARRRPLVIAARDADRHEPAARQLAALTAGRPDAVVVDLGWPSPAPRTTAARVRTFGAAPPSTAAAARLLSEHTRSTVG